MPQIQLNGQIPREYRPGDLMVDLDEEIVPGDIEPRFFGSPIPDDEDIHECAKMLGMIPAEIHRDFAKSRGEKV